MTRKITKYQAKVIIRRQEQVNFILHTLFALALGLVSYTLAIAWFAGGTACTMRGLFLTEELRGPHVRVPATALALALPWLTLIASGEYFTNSYVSWYLLITMVPAIYFGMIHRENQNHVYLLANCAEDPMVV
jgi:hypothetical protein